VVSTASAFRYEADVPLFIPGVNLDQGAEGECVGFGWADFLAAAPKPQTLNLGSGADDEASEPETIYRLAQQYDGSPPDEQSGASVTGGAQAAKSLGHIVSYSWCLNGVSDVVAALRSHGPVVLGTNWLQSMFTPDASGRIHATGAVAGGHCYLAVGVDASGSLIEIRNSWGAGWGVGGNAFLSTSDLGALLAASGEACVPVKP